MNTPLVYFRITQSRILSPSEGTGNSVTMIIDTKFYDVRENPTTGRRFFTGRSTSVNPPVYININLLSSSPSNIFQQLLWEQGIQDANRLYLLSYLAEKISTAAISLGYGRNGFVMEIYCKVFYENVVVRSDHTPRDELLSLKAFLLRLVRSGSVGYTEETKGLKMETEPEGEPCSICLDNLISRDSNSKRGVPTRMTCSHVFHDGCLLEWLQRKNTCPLCRTVLYDRSTILNSGD